MSFTAGALKGLTGGFEETLAQREAAQRAIQQAAVNAVLDPNTPEELREQYRALLVGTPFERLASIQIPTTPEQALARRFGPLLSSLQVLGAFGQAGILTPEMAAEIERTAGQQFLPRRAVPGEVITPAKPAVTAPVVGEISARTGGLPVTVDPRTGQTLVPQVLEPAQLEVRGPEREEIDVSRLTGAGAISIRLADGRQIPLESLRGLPSDLVMFLVRGERGQPQTYGQVFGDIIRPELRTRPIVYDDNGRMVLRDEFFTPQVTPGQVLDQQKAQRQQMAITRYRQVLRQTNNPQQAWLAASEIDPITFKPDLPSATDEIRLAEYQRRTRAMAAYNQIIVGGGTPQQAYQEAYKLDPTMPYPADIPRPGATTPQQAVWGKYFAGQALNPEEQRFIENELTQRAAQDPRFLESMRIVSNLGGGFQRNAQEEAIYQQALRDVATYFGVPPEQVAQQGQGFVARVKAALNHIVRGTPLPQQGGQPTPGTERQWAEALFTEMKQQVGTDRRALEREFNRLRRAPNASRFPQSYWRALFTLIQQSR